LSSLERDHVPSVRPIPAKEVPLVDRIEEMNALREAVYRAVHGEGGLVFVHGEAGIGKTRLLRELGTYARSRGVQVLYGRCPALFRMDGVPPYIIWKEVIKDYLGECTPEQLYRVIGYYPAEVAKLVPEIGQKLRTIPQSLQINPEQEQNRLFEAVSQFITNISQETALLVVLDDLQWTDPSSLLLLHYLARGVQKTPLLLLGAYRSTDVDDKHPLTPVLAELNRERLLQELQLKRMSLGDVSEMIKNILEQEDVPEEFCKLVYEKTRGNPFFAEEVTKSLKEEGSIYQEKGKWKFKEISAIEFPKSVKNIVKARFSRLDDECQNVLTMASFVGNDFTIEAMYVLTSIEENKLLEIMDKLIKTGFVKHTVTRGEDICSFADIIMRDIVHDEVGPFKRKKLHGDVGKALEKVYANKIDEHLGELASHFLEGGNKEKALDYFLKAGEKAAIIYANAEAASYFQSALRLLEEKKDEFQDRGSVLEHLGDIKKLVGEYDACMKYWDEASQLWTKLQEKEKTATLHRKMANVLWNNMGDSKKAKEHHEAAFEILEIKPESAELARLYEDVAEMVSMGATGKMAEALSWAEKAVELAKRLNAYEVIARSYACLGEISGWLGESKKSIECFDKALEIALDKGYMDTALWVYNDAGMLPDEEYAKTLEYFEKGFELAKKVGDTSWMTWIGSNLAWANIHMGNLDKAVNLLEESVALDKKAGNIPHLSMSLGILGLAYQILGEWEESEQYRKDALSISQKLDDFQSIGGSCGHIGWLYFDMGEYAKAREFGEKMYEVFERHGAKSTQMASSRFVIPAYIELGDVEKAQDLIDNMKAYALKMKNKVLIAYADGLTAILLRTRKKWQESIEQFEKTLQEFEALEARRWNVYWFAKMVIAEYARVYLERNQEGDKEKAHSLLNQALEMFQKMGAKKDIEKVEARLLYIETGRVASVPKPAELIATGYADLDKLLCGGLRSSSAVVLTSPSCNERDSLIKSFLNTGAETGEVTFYVTIDPSSTKSLAEEFSSNFFLFVFNPQADAIVNEASNIFKLKGVENLTDIGIALTSAIRSLDPSRKEARRICIGLISDLLLQHHAVQTRRWLTGLISELRSNGFTTMAVMDPEMHPPQEVRAVLDLFEGQIDIYEKETEKGLQKFLKIKRMSNQRYLKDELLLKEEDFEKK
jgi:tetratricopeptide (TPR) repeat protein/KaiC/GvpD/RAD55 family RecA-like ATPase